MDIDTKTTAPVILIRGDLARAAENAVEDAIVELTTGCPKLRKEYIGVKDYDRFIGQREDHKYGYGPAHGYIVFAIELTPEARDRLMTGGELTTEEIAEAVAMLRPKSGTVNPLALFGPPPKPTVVVENPEYAAWIERAAISLCDGHGPSPCVGCLRLARRYAAAGRQA